MPAFLTAVLQLHIRPNCLSVAQRWQLRFPAAALAALAALGPAGCLNAGCAACGAGGDSAASGGGSYRPVSPHCLRGRPRLRFLGAALFGLAALGPAGCLDAGCAARAFLG